MMVSPPTRVEREGWRLEVYTGRGGLDSAVRDALIEQTMAMIHGEFAKPVRRSRHAVTHRMRLRAGDAGELIVFIKLFDAPRGAAVLERLIRGSRARAALRATRAVETAGFGAPVMLMVGKEGAAGRTLLATQRVDGDPIPRFIAGRDLKTRRATLRALGGEIGRFHLAGFVHGDLTPFNIFVTRGEPPGFVFIDHERTRHAALVGRRRQLRNLVQLGRFDLAGVSRTDRMRVFRAWADALGVRRRRSVMRRALEMLAARIKRNGAHVRVGPGGEVTIRQGSHG